MLSTPKVIISLTSFPGAIEYAAGAVRSVLNGTVKPDKIVLYVTMKQFAERNLPSELIQLEQDNDIFEIRDYPDDIRSYRKLIPALRDFPEDIIVTIDDDVAYNRNMLKRLLELYRLNPRNVIAHRAKRIAPDKPYKKWKKYRWYHFLFKKLYNSSYNIQTGVGGVLYPPHSLREDMLNPKLFTAIAPTTDDIWFWAAAVSNGYNVLPVPFGQNKPKGLGKPRELSLKTVNFKSGTDRNSAAMKAILTKYPELRRCLETE